MSWKSELRLDDLPAEERLEAMCRDCGSHAYYTVAELLERASLRHAHLDQVEAALRCHRKRCFSPVRLNRADPGDTEAFVGGLA